MNGVYENAVLTALKGRSNLSEIIICTDNDVGGIDVADRLLDILKENGYADIKRILPSNKNWNEYLKQLHGVDFLAAVPHSRKQRYTAVIGELQRLECDADRLLSNLNLTLKNEQYKYLGRVRIVGLCILCFSTYCRT